MELLKIKPTNIIPQTHNLLKSLSEKFCQELFCAYVSLICAQSEDCSGISPGEHNVEPHRAFRLHVARIECTRMCWAPPVFCSLCSAKFFPFFIFPIYFIFMDYKFRCNSHQGFSEKMQLVLQSSQEIPSGCSEGVSRVLPAQKSFPRGVVAHQWRG